jgi:hypothetical protein
VLLLCEIVRGDRRGEWDPPRVTEALSELRAAVMEPRRFPAERRAALFAELRSLGVSYARIAECAADTPDNVIRAIRRRERALARGNP